MDRRLILVILILWQFTDMLQGQIFVSDSKLFTVSDGLVQSHINTIIQDSRGFIWIGTKNGLSRYDGYEFVNYTHQPYDTTSLSDNYVNAISEGPNGLLWIATNKGLNSFDYKTGKFVSFHYDPKNAKSITDDKVLNVYFDSKNEMWVKTLRTLEHFDSKNKTFQNFSHQYDIFRFISGNITFPVLEDKQGQLWVGTKDGLFVFDRDLQTFVNRYIFLEYNTKSLSNDEVRAICEDDNGTIWVGTANGLNMLNSVSKEFDRFYVTANTKSFSGSNHINALYQEKDGQLWVGTSDGLFVFDKHNKRFVKVKSIDNGNIDVPVISITKDKSGILWVGTIKGLVKINLKRPKFKLYKVGGNPDLKFTSNDISAIYSPDAENIFIGTTNAGLNILNRRTNSVQSFDFSVTDEGSNTINCIFEIFRDKYLLGTNNGIIVFNPSTGAYNNLSKIETAAGFEYLIQNTVNTMVQDKYGRIWVGAFNGLFQLSSDLKSIKAYFNSSGNTSTLVNNNILSLALDRKGNLWIGTENGLDQLDMGTGRFIHFDKTKLSSSTIYNIQIDPYENLWVGTASGLNVIDFRSNSVRIITEKEGLSDNLIYALLADNNKNIWVSTNHGINKINPLTYKVRTFDVFDGLQDYEFKHNVAWKSKNGEIFFGGVAGINIFFPDSIVDNKYIPPIVITSIDIINAKGKTQSLNPFSEKIVIPYQTHVFTINFAALDYTLPEKNNFAYKLYYDKEGEWINIGNRHSASFSNLKPGEYILKVKGTNNDFVWNDEGISVVLKIESPFWRKTEAFYLYGFLIVIAVLIIYRYRTYHLRQANRILKEREIAAREIERQKEQLSVKNKNITDSINYAKRIQEALMPSEKTFKKILPESFIFHQPKDIVSGDFFWISERGNKIYVAAVDCTGHGVPGAFMSIIGFELFRKITHSQGVDDPSKILNILNYEFEEIFRDVDTFTLKDGMDIAFCVIDKQTHILEFSGAVNPIYLIRDNKITEIRGSRFSVGLDDNFEEEQTFENKQIILQEDDVIYLFSDGYADQFGGPEGKKFKYRRFRHLLLTIHQYPMEEQQRLLEERINRWKGNVEQVDDILVIGFRPLLDQF